MEVVDLKGFKDLEFELLRGPLRRLLIKGRQLRTFMPKIFVNINFWIASRILPYLASKINELLVAVAAATVCWWSRRQHTLF